MNPELKVCASPSAMPSTASASNIDFNAIKQRQQATWSSGDYAIIGTTLQIVGELLVEAADVRANERVLDIAAGNGNATLAAARRFARVTSTDYVPHLLEKGAIRARRKGLTSSFRKRTPRHCRLRMAHSTWRCPHSVRCSRLSTSRPRTK